jgi:hypothetical protein
MHDPLIKTFLVGINLPPFGCSIPFKTFVTVYYSYYARYSIYLTRYLSKKAPFRQRRENPMKCAKAPFKLSFLPLDAPSSELPFDVPRILVGL